MTSRGVVECGGVIRLRIEMGKNKIKSTLNHVCRHSDWLSSALRVIVFFINNWGMKCKPFRRAGQKSWVSCQMCYHFRSININHFTPNIFSTLHNLTCLWYVEKKETSRLQVKNFFQAAPWFWSELKLPLIISFDIDFFWFEWLSSTFQLFFKILTEIHFDISIVGSSEAWYARFFFYLSDVLETFHDFFFFSFFHALPTRSKKSLQNAKIGSNWIYFTQIDSRM